VKRVIKLVQTYLSLKSVELDIRAFSDDDATLDVRGQPLITTSSTTSAAAAAAAAAPVTSTPDSTQRSLIQLVLRHCLKIFIH